jgi:hypothetical protein
MPIKPVHLTPRPSSVTSEYVEPIRLRSMAYARLVYFGTDLVAKVPDAIREVAEIVPDRLGHDARVLTVDRGLRSPAQNDKQIGHRPRIVVRRAGPQ